MSRAANIADLAVKTTVFIFAAGHGKRMHPLTAHTPKPLLKVGDSTLIEHHLMRLADMGFRHVVINVAYLAEQIMAKLGSGETYGLEIEYSDESSMGALETAGGIKHALPLIKSDRFITVNADIWTDFKFTNLITQPEGHAQLVLVNNPPHNLSGDFGLLDSGKLTLGEPKYTFSGIASYQTSLFDELEHGKQALGPVFKRLIEQERICGVKFDGEWRDIGTPERLQQLNEELL